jgi:ribonucleoside-diphosphate reductase subunit M1
MFVITRSGEKENVRFDKITKRLQDLAVGLDERYVDATLVAQDTISRMSPGMTTEELDNLSADICATQIIKHPDFNKFAARICISNLHKSTDESFYTVMKTLYQNKNSEGVPTPIISKELWEITKENYKRIEKEINFERDYEFDFFGIKTLERAYLLRKKLDINIKTNGKGDILIKGKIIERPQHMWMRVAIGIHGRDLESAFESYHLMSQKYFTHATPTLFNSGTPSSQLSSCFLLGMDDSIKGIYKTLTDSAEISKRAGGIGIHISAIRSKGSIIRGTNGRSDGIVPMCKVVNETGVYVNQSGKRKGSIAVYIEPWHADIISFLELKYQTGDEKLRARDLFTALWIPDLFMERVKENGDWCLMCPNECPNLVSTFGDKFNELYIKYENDGRYKKKIKAQELWYKILETQIKTGLPYLAFKDSVNKKTNQNNLGVIRSSNLCCEIVQYSSDKEYSVCNLASIGLPKFIKYPKINETIKIYTKTGCKYCKMSKECLINLGYDFFEIVMDNNEDRKIFYKEMNVNIVPQIYFGEERIGGYIELKEYLKPKFNFEKLREVSKVITNNLNKIIDINYYPVYETRLSNLRHRPMGIGVQGLADIYNILDLSWGSDEASNLNKKIFETIYYESMKESNRLAMDRYDDIKRIKELITTIVNSDSVNNSVKDKINEILNLNITNTNDYITKLNELTNNKKVFVEIPHLYDPKINFSNDELNTLYHKNKPIREEIEREDQFGSYSSFIGSNFSKGKFQFNLWGFQDKDLLMDNDWDTLRENVIKYGTRNSLLTALMPTASTSQILGNNECFEPYTSNLYLRTSLAGEYIVINQHLIRKLMELGLWNKEMRDEIMYFNGSIQEIENIPDDVKRVYMTSFDMPQKYIVQQSIDRGPFVDQSQSLNLFSEVPDYNSLTSSHFYGWKHGLKTGLYYLRSKPTVDPIKFGIDNSSLKKIKKKYMKKKYNTDLIDDISSDGSDNNDIDESNVNYKSRNTRTFEVCDVCSG